MYSTIWSPSVSTCRVAGGTVASLQLRVGGCFFGYPLEVRQDPPVITRIYLQHTKVSQSHPFNYGQFATAGIVVRQRWGLVFWVSMGGEDPPVFHGVAAASQKTVKATCGSLSF
ncbi:hypothetical protein E3N88_05350 [Mikania micrantha]|uniref:Uncharacterized protein n=1 Tax=Mikania micrantha TaxID=192012 RepID=A0A5N6PKP9_9ASTR|nr:hypothetical protein E3N88_05350 [Mikania micrantha]